MENPLGHHLRELPGPLLLTGHTGFKGTWMTFLLEYLNVPVVGYSLPPQRDSLFTRAERISAIPEAFADVRDYEAFEKFIDLHKPSTIIHMAAQPLVLRSYENPRETFDVNVMGTVNLLDIAAKRNFVKSIVVVTTDKVYRNNDTGKDFTETDPLEGKDPYSASKVGTEAAVTAYQQVARISGGPRVTSVRAGNVIGGGDFAENRLVPDLIRAYQGVEKLAIRNLESTRPWQHVLDPLIGYLMCLETKIDREKLTSINFGPTEKSLTVRDVIAIGSRILDHNFLSSDEQFNSQYVQDLESRNLQLNTNKAINLLQWQPAWSQVEGISATFRWWERILLQGDSPGMAINEDIVFALNKYGSRNITGKDSQDNLLD